MKMLEEGQNQPQIAQKRTKFQEEIAEKGGEDGISALPDCLILEILSRLPSTKEAIRTSTLSKRWAHLWTWLPTLIFLYSSQPLDNPSAHALLVDKTLTQCRQSKLKKFEVHALYDIQLESQFRNWIHYAISHNVEELNLEFFHIGKEAEFRLDQILFFGSHLTDMRLVGCMLNPNPSGPISWKNLRSLCISHVKLNEDLIVNILSGSPLLENLVLEYYYGHSWADDSDDEPEPESESESESGSESESEPEDDDIQINVPKSLSLTRCPQLKLKTFKVLTHFQIKFQSILNSWIRYAVRCNVEEFILLFMDTDPRSEFMLDQIVFTASCFTELKLIGCILNPVRAISWKGLKSLCISWHSLDEDFVENILYGSPVLESLELDGCYGFKRLDITSKSVKNLVISGYWNPHDKFENDIIEINAPNILSLTIQGTLTLGKFLLLNVSSLVKANLDYHCTTLNFGNRHTMPKKEAEEEILKGYIMSLGHVKELQIGLSCLEAVLFASSRFHFSIKCEVSSCRVIDVALNHVYAFK